jgi:hypothetical protein
VKLKIKSQEDFWAGIMFIGFGLAAIIVARDYPLGSAMRMGPGYFPTYLGAIMIVLGAIITARSLWVQGEGIGRWGWRPVVMLGLGFIVYGLFMEQINLGFVPALIALIVLSSFAEPGFRPVELVLLTIALLAIALGIFIFGLDLPYTLFWWR